MLSKIYADEQITSIRAQAIIFSCACPAQVCVAIDSIRDLHAYQAACIEADHTDKMVHAVMKSAAERNHAILEECLSEVLRLEGWDEISLEMPSNLRKRLLGENPEQAR
jgi:hypothetical protein